ncbi:MAG TPA: choice-of-anchor D domain-containing protein [Terriglobales bacterium]|nr:choice-of-anchor D domain-containing protein [Terriglobales bacterium]
MSNRLFIPLFIFSAILATAVPAQSQVLQVFATANGGTSTIGAGGTVALTSSGPGQPVFANITVRYIGTATATLTGISLSGTSEITLLQTPLLPITLNPDGVVSFAAQYLPSTGGSTSAQVSIGFTEKGVASSFVFTITGSSARLTYSYSFTTTGAVTALNPGDRITLPSTNVGAPVTATINVQNSGTAATLLQSIGLTGSGFQLTSGTAPIQLNPGQQTSFNVVFTPQTAGATQGSLVLGLTGSSVSFALLGTGTSPSFTLSYTLSDGNAHTLSAGSAIAFPSVDLNGTATAVIDIVNQGTGAGTVTGISVTGTGFRITGQPVLPATVAAGQAIRFQFVFSPAQAGSFTGTFNIALSNSSISGTLSGSTAAPSFSVAYVEPDTNNVRALQDGSTVPFPNTLINTTSSITLLVTNNGSGTGLLNSIALGGSSASVFQILSQPPLPLSIPPAQQSRLGIRFSPLQQQTFSAALVLNLNGQTFTINLTAQGIGPQFTYTWSNAAGMNVLSPGGTIAIADTNVGQTSSITISVTNTGSGDGQVSPVSVSGQGFSIANLPAVPFTLHANASQSFTLNFAPTQPETINGTLTIGGDTFGVTGTGIGSRLVYSYTNSAASISVAEGGVVIFQPIPVESKATLTFSIQNTGTTSTTLSSINLAAASTVFTLQQLPPLPSNLNPGDTVTFAVGFVPNNTGSLTATLRVNNSSFTLSGTGTPPASLPAYQFQGPAGNAKPAQQSSVGLTLASAYAMALQGTLKLTFASSVFTDDPSIQFATGGRTVPFTIPANSTDAVFANGAKAVPIQTGTTAGTISITPTFATTSGFDLTPSSPDALTLTIPRSVPQLSGASISSVTATGFTVTLSGFSTTRGLTQLDIQITPKQGETFSTTHLTLDVSSGASAWFQGTASQPFGGAFMVGIPFALSNGNATEDLVHHLQSLSITASNDVGASGAVTVSIP